MHTNKYKFIKIMLTTIISSYFIRIIITNYLLNHVSSHPLPSMI